MGLFEVLQNVGGNPQPGVMPVNTGYTDPFESMNALQKIGIGLGGVDAVNAVRNNAMSLQDRQRKDRQMEALRALAERMQRGDLTQDEALVEYAGITGDYSGLFGVGAKAPAALQIYDRVRDMTPEERDLFFRTQRGQKTLDLGGQQVVLNPQGGLAETYDKSLTPENVPENVANRKRAEVVGQDQGEKETNIGKLEQQADYMIQTIDQLLGAEQGLAEGVDEVVGGVFGMQGRQSSVFPISENQRKFQPIIDQIKGQTFLEAYERLKGGGVITEIEGAKAEQAIARLNQAQDEKDFEAALRELREVIGKGLERAKSETFENNKGGYTQINWDNVNVGGGSPSNAATRKTIKFGDLQ